MGDPSWVKRALSRKGLSRQARWVGEKDAQGRAVSLGKAHVPACAGLGG